MGIDLALWCMGLHVGEDGSKWIYAIAFYLTFRSYIAAFLPPPLQASIEASMQTLKDSIASEDTESMKKNMDALQQESMKMVSKGEEIKTRGRGRGGGGRQDLQGGGMKAVVGCM